VLGLRADALGASEGELAASMFVGALAWTSLAEALTRSATSIGEHAELVKKVPFAAEILPLQRCLVALTTALLGAAVFVLARLAVTRDLGALAQLAWLAPTVVVHATLCFGLGLLAAALQVLVRDVVHALTLGLSLAMLVTPVFWIADARALPAVAPYLPWVDLNPLHHLMSAWRVALSCELAQVSIPRSLAIAGAWALVALFAGACTFSIAQRRFADEV
jgi:ABC-type polysaccharide/polyol phosphate export permease